MATRVGLIILLVLAYCGAIAGFAAAGLGALTGLAGGWWVLPAAVVLFTPAGGLLLPLAGLGLVGSGYGWALAVVWLLPALLAFALAYRLGGVVQACRKLYRAWRNLF